METPARAGRDLRLDGIRGIAVLLVLLYHAETPRRLLPGDSRLLPGGWIGVQIFFVLSGYLITRLLLKELRATGTIDRRRFYRRRVARLLPALAVLLGVWLLLTVSGLLPVQMLGSTAPRLPLGLAFVPVVGMAALGFNWLCAVDLPTPVGMVHLWTLSVEEQFYLVLPTLVLYFAARSRRPEHWIRQAVVGGIGVSLLCSAIATKYGYRDMVYFSTPTSGLGILLGAAVALKPPRRRFGAIGLAGMAVIMAIAFTVPDYRRDLLPWAMAGSGLAAALVIGHGGRLLDRLLEARWLRWSGRRSYAIYLWSIPIGYAAEQWIGLGWTMDAVMIVTSLAFGELSWRLVERRFLAHREQPAAAERGVVLGPVPAESA
jgi:peptidoglycan/LPS O-acetylase OafA/YrhL